MNKDLQQDRIDQDTKQEITKEAERIEEDAQYSSKGHFILSNWWSYAHYIVGVPMTVFAAWASIKAFPQYQFFIAMATVGFASLHTFINPSEKAAQHKQYGSEFSSLKNEIRIFRNIDLKKMEEKEAIAMLKSYSQKLNDLNKFAPSIMYLAYLLACRGINSGEAAYNVDKEKKDDK